MKAYKCFLILFGLTLAPGCKPSECEGAMAPAREIRAAVSEGGEAIEIAAAAERLVAALEGTDVPEFSWLGFQASRFITLAPDYTSPDVPSDHRERVAKDWDRTTRDYQDAYREVLAMCE